MMMLYCIKETALITATFGSPQTAASISISGLLTDTLMSVGASSTLWYYYWTVPDTTSTTISINASGTNAFGKLSTSVNTLTFALNPVLPDVAY